MPMKRYLVIAAVAIVVAAACSNRQPEPNATPPARSEAITLVGAGSSFVYPFFSRAFDEYRKIAPNVSINYQSIGSGGGIQQFTAQTVDFGATDVPMNAKELSAVASGPANVLQIPVALGGVAIVYNVPDAPVHLVLTPDVLVSIFLGKVTNWNDPAIAAHNAGAKLASLPIVVIHRADGSGTTYIFTDYLSAVSPEWKANIGTAKTVSWPAASSVGMKGNEGVAGQVKNTPGAIGYVELAYALQTHMSFAALENKSGHTVIPSIASVKAAAAAEPEVNASRFSIVNAPGAGSYPLAGYTWVLLYKHYQSAAKQKALCNLFHWLDTDGQKMAPQIDYVDLPAAVSTRSMAALGPCI
jgi:phosphate transport system substrate-binding protein